MHLECSESVVRLGAFRFLSVGASAVLAQCKLCSTVSHRCVCEGGGGGGSLNHNSTKIVELFYLRSII